MSDISTGALAGTTAAVISSPQRSFWKRCVRSASWLLPRIPLFLYLLVVFVGTKYFVPDLRATFFVIGSYALDYVEVLYIAAFIVAMAELLRVAKPGIDNSREVLLMFSAAMTYIVLFTLAAASVGGLAIFKNSEFLVLVVVVIVQSGMAQLINAATLKRTIDNSDSNNH